MVEDILHHGAMLNDIEFKGESIIVSNRGAPKFAENTRDQVKQLKDGYANLMTSAKQNQVRNPELQCTITTISIHITT